MTLHKCGHRLERFLAARRDVRREVAPSPGPDESGPALEAIARDPTPSEAAVLAELVEQLHRELGARDRHILMLSLQGHGVEEVAEQVGCTQRTVYRVLGWIRERLRQGVAEEAAPG
jgi:RNA polymerase sigma factor (sigma-70 family)